MISSIFKGIVILVALLLICGQLISFALPQSFDPTMVPGNSDVNQNKHFNSAADIQKYLVENNSILAQLSFPASLEADDDLIISPSLQSKPNFLKPELILKKYTELKTSEIVWELAQGELGNGCHIIYTEVCINNFLKPIDPALLITLLQKESGLVYGTNAKKSLTPDLQFIIDRATGYFCFENPDKSKSCYDENPNWKYFKGFFRQLYFASRFLRLWSERCERGGKYAFKNSSGTFVVDNTVIIDGQNILLHNGITCAMYIYTPHLSAQRLVYNIYKSIPIKYTAGKISYYQDPNYQARLVKQL